MVHRFGAFIVDDDIRQLLRGNTEVHLSPKAFELLTMLLANRARAVSKAEIQQHLWPATFVEETNIASLVAEIRRALGDSASSPMFVRTVYGFGYRFVGEVTAGPIATSSISPHAKICLVWEQREIVLMAGVNVIGREPDATIRIDARGVSRRHAQILVSDGDAALEDLGSKNGSYVNGQRVTVPVRLSEGDEIGLGTVTLTFHVASPMSPTETVPRA